MTVTFSHTGMVHHEKVHIEIIRACTFDLVVFCKGKLQNWIHEKQANECVPWDGLKRHTYLFQ